MKLHERITRWREHAGLTKAELARECDVSSSAEAQWEAPDGTEPSHANVERIAKACKTTLSAFWGTPPAKKKREAKAS